MEKLRDVFFWESMAICSIVNTCELSDKATEYAQRDAIIKREIAKVSEINSRTYPLVTLNSEEHSRLNSIATYVSLGGIIVGAGMVVYSSLRRNRQMVVVEISTSELRRITQRNPSALSIIEQKINHH